ncbi:hypothetical protein D5272_12795 [bacterium D16-76]|nr:hypothetical protein [bacterium D16-76]
MSKTTEKLAVVDGETLLEMRLPPSKFCIDTLLPQGISMLGGAPKTGKSWLVLDWCVRIAKGEPVWGFRTKQGTTLYLCLEDPLRRVQERLCQLTDEAPPNAFFATAAEKLGGGLCEQIQDFVREHPDTVLVAIDTFQIVRAGSQDVSYANDYEEVRKLKALADETDIALLLVHHLRKQGASDPVNKLSGTTGISGAMDALFILDRSQRSGNTSTMLCTGRDIETRQIELRFSKSDCAWERVQDSLETRALETPEELAALIKFIRTSKTFDGGNTQLAFEVSKAAGKEIQPRALKQMMNRWRYALEERGVFFCSRRSNGQRLVTVSYSPALPGSAASDVSACGTKSCVPCDPADAESLVISRENAHPA